MQEIKNTESWNKKKIFITLFIIVVIIISYLFKTLILDKNVSVSPTNFSKSVKGVITSRNSDQVSDTSSQSNIPDIQTLLQQKINTIKQEVEKLNIVEIASSSPQIQKVINDINSIKQYPSNEVKNICQKICSGL